MIDNEEFNTDIDEFFDNDINDISIGFAKTLNQFYKKKRNS